jgi:hypothetical protein
MDFAVQPLARPFERILAESKDKLGFVSESQIPHLRRLKDLIKIYILLLVLVNAASDSIAGSPASLSSAQIKLSTARACLVQGSPRESSTPTSPSQGSGSYTVRPPSVQSRQAKTTRTSPPADLLRRG